MGSSDFRLNGRDTSLAGAEPTESLLRWLHRGRLTGTKEGCADGDCGACTVALVERLADEPARFRAVQSCLLPVGLLPGREVVTVEALADGDTLHPVQQAMVGQSGSQCGYCTPGFVMSLFAGYYGGELDDRTIEGNLCRCTGYLPIRRATAELARAPRMPDRFSAALEGAERTSSASLGACFSPATVGEALALRSELPNARWIAGATDIGVSLSHGAMAAPQYIALDRIASLRDIDVAADAVRIGAGASLSAIEARLAGTFPMLDQMLAWFAGRQIRNRATLGGNLGTASPIGDLLPVLLALDATVYCEGPQGARALPIDGFFLGYRRHALAPDELVTSVSVPLPAPPINAAYKVAKRQTDDISIVAAAFALALDGERRVGHARLAYGGVAAVPARARAVEAMLLGQRLDEAVVERAALALDGAFAPIDDHRASAAYRRALAGNLFRKFVAEHAR